MVHARGRFMQEAVPEGHGAMAAVLGASEAEVGEACRLAAAQTGRVVTPANYNSPGQTVIAGDAAAVEVACAMARERGAKRTIPLAVSAPFHCALMAPAAEKLALELARVRFADARPPVVTNVEAEPNSEGARFAALLREQVTAPVRFVEMVRRMQALGRDEAARDRPRPGARRAGRPDRPPPRAREPRRARATCRRRSASSRRERK